MCGITGMLVADGLTDLDRLEVDALTELMVRRGPDDLGAWDDGAVCALGFRRLSIIDLSQGGHQPMLAADGEHALVFNGELYNYRELRRELEAAGRSFRSSSDTEVVLQSLQAWGTAALARFNGMFALAWYQVREHELLLARDPVGIKPLSWWWSPDAFVFGSQYDQVVRHRRCERTRVEPDVLGLYLRLGFVPAPYGIVEGTGQVEPGHWLSVRPGQAPVEGCFRELASAPDPSQRLFGTDADDAVAAMVDEAVARQLVADVPVGVFLSGGVDSPLVAAAMVGATEGKVSAFSIGTDDPESDESAAATAYAEILGVEQHLRTIRGADAFALMDDVAQAYPEPFGDYSSFPTLMVSELASQHVKAVLSGDGGDELFWGYPRFAKVRQARPWFAAPRPLRQGAYLSSKFLPGRRPARGIMFRTIGDWYLDAHSGLRDADFAEFAPTMAALPESLSLFTLEGTPTDDEVLQWMRRNELACHLPMVLQKVDRASMYHGLEVRVPLLDLELCDLAARVDPSAALDGTLGKTVLRNALARHVPREKIPVPKKGFTVPLGRWLREDLRPVVEERLLGPDAFPSGVFDRAGLRTWYGRHLAGERTLTRGLWNLLALQLWADVHCRPLSLGPTRTVGP